MGNSLFAHTPKYPLWPPWLQGRGHLLAMQLNSAGCMEAFETLTHMEPELSLSPSLFVHTYIHKHRISLLLLSHDPTYVPRRPIEGAEQGPQCFFGVCSWRDVPRGHESYGSPAGSRAGQGRAGQGRAGQGRAGQKGFAATGDDDPESTGWNVTFALWLARPLWSRRSDYLGYIMYIIHTNKESPPPTFRKRETGGRGVRFPTVLFSSLSSIHKYGASITTLSRCGRPRAPPPTKAELVWEAF
ncbi:hypothetical protein MAPG_07433 [Magnaporthiopsis poae ATCC 64411]|uniref:Uncharacterized protein n=1 Tax=Magnaporthiopsis poae (strain ATCC 64411 / 73-15) TaxID=644358 RepID=A0A0C4E4N6_MAGP6|nr:hypothetical protein MAPG_07433 [Magnaporthiopsis poae ATCC 64411]